AANSDAHLVDAICAPGKDRGLVAQYLFEAGPADALQYLLGAERRIERELVGVHRLGRRVSLGEPITALGLAAPFEAHWRLREQAQRDVVQRGHRAAFE